MKHLLLFALPIFLIWGCVSEGRMNIRNDLLITRQRREDFIKEWGRPTRTFAQSGHAEGFGVGWVGDKQKPGGNFALRSNRSYDLWYYANKKVTLVFDREILVAWAWGDEPQLLGPESK
jgi:hypothetical protein